MSAPREIVLLTGAQEGPHLTAFLHRHRPDLAITHVQTRDELTVALHPRRPGIRLIAFCTSVVVPADLLARVDGPAYNFHPGPPTYPGRHPASFAIYEGATRFGATAHEMRVKVDSGPIVGVEWFDMPAPPRLSQLEALTFDAAVRLFTRLGAPLATSSTPLPPLGVAWHPAGRRHSQPHDLDPGEGRQPPNQDHRHPLARPAHPDLDTFWQSMRDFLDGTPGRSIILGLNGFHDHWTVIRGITSKSIFLYVSAKISPLRRSEYSTSRRRRKHLLLPAQTYFLSNA